MKKVLIFTLIGICFNVAFGAYLTNIPQRITQPDGLVIDCFASGDEFFNWLHDKDGYTIIQDADGYYYYGETKNGIVVPTKHKVGAAAPSTLKLSPWSKVSLREYLSRRSALDVTKEAAFYSNTKAGEAKSPGTSLLNNIVILVRFSDDAEFLIEDVRRYDSNLNAHSASMIDYFREVSYQQLEMPSLVLPYHINENVLSYQDIRPRKYFQPYNQTTNPDGYRGDDENYSRKVAMMKRAVDWVNQNTPVPQDLNLDYNNDGLVDNVTFLVYGKSGAWASLLWPHRSQVPTSYGIKINGKSVYDYTFNPVDQADRYTLCHEMFHSLGAPDLYHYSPDFDHLSPAGPWDQMESGQGHMLTHMKERYGKWLTIPEIKSSGYYELKPVMSGKDGIAYRCYYPTIDNHESVVLEYRQQTGDYESQLPGSGLLVTRVNKLRKGNAEYDGKKFFDEVYVFRPGGSPTRNGDIGSANLSDLKKRSSINDTTDPAMYRPRGNAIQLSIYDIKDHGDKLSFKIFLGENFDPINVNGFADGTKINLSWEKFNNNKVIVFYNPEFTDIDFPKDGTAYNVGDQLANGSKVVYVGDGSSFVHNDHQARLTAHYKVHSVKENNIYSQGVSLKIVPSSNTVVCEETSNIGANDTLTLSSQSANVYWGYLSGHSSLGKVHFAEERDPSDAGFLNGVTIDFGKVHAADNETSKILVWVAYPDNDPEKKIGEKIYWQEVKISTLSVGKKYIAFDKPVYVSGKHYVGYSIDYLKTAAKDTIAVQMAKHSERRKNTAYAYGRSNWLPLVSGGNISFSIAGRLCNGEGQNTEVFSVFPSQISINGNQGASGSFGVWTNKGEWVLSDVPTWLSVIKDYTKGQLWVYASANTTGAERTASIKVSVGGTTEILTVKQGMSTSINDEGNEIVSVYPNPSQDGRFTLVSPHKTTYEVIDFTGKILLSSTVNTGEVQLDLSSFPSGMYFVRMKDNAQYRIIKLVKQ